MLVISDAETTLFEGLIYRDLPIDASGRSIIHCIYGAGATSDLYNKRDWGADTKTERERELGKHRIYIE